MFTLPLLAAFLGLLPISLATVYPNKPANAQNSVHPKTQALKPFRAATPDKPAEHFQQLKRGRLGKSRLVSALAALHKSQGKNFPAIAQLQEVAGLEYLVPIQFGDQSFMAILDTGSSDTWVISSELQCVSILGEPRNQTDCDFGPPFKGELAETAPNLIFNLTYGDLEFVYGDMGYEDVTIAGITVNKQQVALVTRSYWNGDGIASGLIGLAYPALTYAFPFVNDTTGRSIPYDPLFTTMYKQGRSPPSFSLALQRGDGGYIAFGGLPPVNVTGDFAKTDIQPFIVPGDDDPPVLEFYTMTPDAIVFKGINQTEANVTANTAQYIVDSGTTLNYLPGDLAAQLGSLFSPPAVSGFVKCNATAPGFGVTIGGTTFYADKRDLILTDLPDEDGNCYTAFQDGGEGPYILGDAWMKSVVIVFDVGASEMRFASHVY